MTSGYHFVVIVISVCHCDEKHLYNIDLCLLRQEVTDTTVKIKMLDPVHLNGKIIHYIIYLNGDLVREPLCYCHDHVFYCQDHVGCL